MNNTHALATNDMNAVQEHARRDASPAVLEHDKRKRKVGVSHACHCIVQQLMVDEEMYVQADLSTSDLY
jgi:hypothetical protein